MTEVWDPTLQVTSLHYNKRLKRILNRGGFSIKSWEKSGTSKYLGMTWDRLKDLYSLKFCLNLHKKSRGIPSGADLDSKFLQDESIPVTKKNVLSVACQFHDPTGLAAPLMFSVRALFPDKPNFVSRTLQKRYVR